MVSPKTVTILGSEGCIRIREKKVVYNDSPVKEEDSEDL
jgi:hypothetical protein